MDFCFRRAGRLLMAAGAFALVTTVSVPVAIAQDAAQQPAGKNYKDRGEYDIFLKVTQTPDAKARLALLDTWRDKYPTTDYATERLQYYVATLAQLAPTDATQRQPLINKCVDLLKVDAKNANAMFLISQWGPAVGGATPPPDLLSQVDSAAHGFINEADTAFAPTNKPANISADDFAKAKSYRLGVAHNALAWEASVKKDNATAENEYKESLKVNPEQGNVSAALGKILFDEKKTPEALFEYARAGQYSGPGLALPPAGRTQSLDFFNKAYQNYHGSADGKDQVLTQSKNSALPPDGFTIGSAQAAADADAKKLEDRMNSDPAFKLWYTVKTNLVGDQGQSFFDKSVKDTEIPGGAQGVKDFSGTVISLEPAEKPTKATVGVEDATKADTTLIFSEPLPAAALEKIKVGEKIDFGGIAESFTKDPFMLTFKDPTIPGAQLATPPARSHRSKK